MKETKLTVRVPRDLLENVKRYAAENNGNSVSDKKFFITLENNIPG